MMTGKRIADSQLNVSQFMMPEHANPWGTVHGGIVMKLVDETGGLCAMRHARRPVVTVAIDSMTFYSPVHVGDLLILTATCTWTGRTTIEVEVKVQAENPITGEQARTHTAFLVYVALDEQEKPVLVPPLILDTEEEQRRWHEGARRQLRRLNRQQAERE